MYRDYINRIGDLLLKDIQFINGNTIVDECESGFCQLYDMFKKYKGKRSSIYFIGNGGSAAIAQHMIADFFKNGGLKTQSLYNQANITCLGNDIGYEEIFSKQIESLYQEGDLLVAISSSGNSKNIVNSINTIKKLGGEVITFTGFKEDNECKLLGDFNVYVPIEHYGMVESIHNLILQQVVDFLQEEESSNGN